MKTLFIFRRDLRLNDNTTLIYADNLKMKIVPIFIFDPHQIEDKNKSNNCVQFLLESIMDLNRQLREYNSKVYTYYGKPWEIVEQMLKKDTNIENVCMNKDYTVYSKYRDDKIERMCKKYNKNFITQEDCLLNNIETIKTGSGKHYEKFTPYYDTAKKYKIREVMKHNYKNLITNYDTPVKIFKNYNLLFEENKNIYIHGGRDNGLKILKQISIHENYNKVHNEPIYDTTLLSPHNKFGTVSIREVYHLVKNKLGNRSEILRQLYWRDFYYNQIYFNENYFYLQGGKYDKINWKNNSEHYKKWKEGTTGIPIVDAGMKQLNKTGWIHNRIRLLVATTLTKILLVDWRLGEKYFKKKLIDYDVTQNIMNWFWVSGELALSSPYFRILNPNIQTEKYDKECKYVNKWSEKKPISNCSISTPIVDIKKNTIRVILTYKSMYKKK